MLNRTIKQMSAVLAGVTLSFGLATAALAIPLTGNITIGGQLTPDFNANSVTFTDIGAGPENGLVNQGTPTLPLLHQLAPLIVYTDFAYDGSALPVNPLWTDPVSGLSFELTAVSSWSDDPACRHGRFGRNRHDDCTRFRPYAVRVELQC